MNDFLPEWLNPNSLPDWVHWVAQDADGSWWAYEVEPLQYHAGWYENELGERLLLRKDVANKDWQRSLIRMRS
jgi:poly(3-hydroxyalkanoate) synthetase